MTERVLARIGNVEEAVLVLEVRVDLAHGGGRLRDGLVDEQENGLLRWELDAFADDPHELRYRDVVGHEELALVDLGDLRVGDALDHHRDAVWVLGADLLSLAFALLQVVLFAESEFHFDRNVVKVDLNSLNKSKFE